MLKLFLFSLATVLIIQFACCKQPKVAGSPGCGLDAPAALGVSVVQNIDVNDPLLGSINRGYRLHLPPGYDKNTPTPLVLDYHGYSDSAQSLENSDKLNVVADKEGFIIVYPEGYNDGTRSWNCVGTTESTPLGRRCASDHSKYDCYTSCQKQPGGCNVGYTGPGDGCDCSSCTDDLGFTKALLDKLENTLCINKLRIHATGMSNGAMMTYEVGIKMSDRFASIAPTSGSPLLGFNAPPPIPLSVMDIHGSSDDVVPANTSSKWYNYKDGPHGSKIASDGFYYHRKPEILATWMRAGSCTGSLKPYPTKWDGIKKFSCISHGTCVNGVSVVSCSWNGGHTWPIFPRRKNVYGELVWEFFKNHPKSVETVNPVGRK